MKIRKQLNNNSKTSRAYLEKCFNYMVEANISEDLIVYLQWLKERFGSSMYQNCYEGNKNKFLLLDKHAVYDHWGYKFYFLNKNDALLFKTTFNGDFQNLKEVGKNV